MGPPYETSRQRFAKAQAYLRLPHAALVALVLLAVEAVVVEAAILAHRQATGWMGPMVTPTEVTKEK